MPEHIKIAQSFVGVKEKTGHNDGPEVEMFLKSVGLGKGYAWCAAFVSYCLDKARVEFPKIRSAIARSFETKESIKAIDVLLGKKKVKDGSIVVWRKGSGLQGHTAFVTHWDRDKGETIEGNTSSGASGSQRDGDGVYKRKRKIEPANYFRITSFLEVK
ncbi:MAG TPA: CHAP domain-containing protein [Ignavibacteriales bacterium]|nr:CHAP domain-containing protein [Ignavibacteriales bacterium]